MLALGLSACNSFPHRSNTAAGATRFSVTAQRCIVDLGDRRQWISTTSTPVQMTARSSRAPHRSSGSTAAIDVTWTVEPAGIVSVDRLAASRRSRLARATVTATLGDKTGGNNVRVLPDYSGNWSGEFVITGCTGGHDFRECGRMMFGEGGPGVRSPVSVHPDVVAGPRSGHRHVTRDPRQRRHRRAGDRIRSSQRARSCSRRPLPQPNHEPFRVINWSSTVNAAATHDVGCVHAD